MKRFLLITVMLLSVLGFGVESAKPVQSSVKLLKGVKHTASAKSKSTLPCRESGTLPNNGEQLIAEFKQVIMLLSQKLPSWYSDSKLVDRRQQVLSAFVVSLGLSLKYSLKPYQPPSVNSKFKPLPLLWLQHNQVAYLRLDGFNADVSLQFQQIKDIFSTNYRLIGMIIDLRNCRSFDYSNAVKCLKQFTHTNRATSLPKVSIAILMGKETLGAAEYFIHSLQCTINPVIIGMKSAGQPFKYQAEKLKAGGYLLVPIIPEVVDKQATFTAQNPTVKLINNSQNDYKLQSKQPDVAVKYASNLLISLNAISGRRQN